jgi:hypothetical protein
MTKIGSSLLSSSPLSSSPPSSATPTQPIKRNLDDSNSGQVSKKRKVEEKRSRIMEEMPEYKIGT